MTTNTAPRPLCPLELEVGKTYTDSTDGSTFTVAAITVKGVAAQITATDGTAFTYGGLYRGLTEVAATVQHPTATTLADITEAILRQNAGDPRTLTELAAEVTTERTQPRPAGSIRARWWDEAHQLRMAATAADWDQVIKLANMLKGTEKMAERWGWESNYEAAIIGRKVAS